MISKTEKMLTSALYNHTSFIPEIAELSDTIYILLTSINSKVDLDVRVCLSVYLSV